MVVPRTRVGGLASQCSQGSPVERPGLSHRLLVDVATKFIKPIDKPFIDDALSRSIGMILDQMKRTLASPPLDELG